MFADPQTVTISGAGQTLARTGVSLSSGTFSKSDSLVELVVGQAAGKRNRRSLRLNHRKIAANPFDSSLNAEYSMSVYVVVDVPKVGYTVAEAQAVVDGFVNYLAASAGGRSPSCWVGRSNGVHSSVDWDRAQCASCPTPGIRAMDGTPERGP